MHIQNIASKVAAGQFKVGDIVEFINKDLGKGYHFNKVLTIGKRYKVASIYNSRYLCLESIEKGHQIGHGYFANRFKKAEET